MTAEFSEETTSLARFGWWGRPRWRHATVDPACTPPVIRTADSAEQAMADHATVALFDEVRAEARVRHIDGSAQTSGSWHSRTGA